MTPNAKKLKTTMNTPSKYLSIHRSPSHRSSRGPVTPKVTPTSGNSKYVNKTAQKDQGDDTSMEGDRVTLGYASDDNGAVKTSAKEARTKDNKGKYSDEKKEKDKNLDSHDDSCTSAPQYYDTDKSTKMMTTTTTTTTKKKKKKKKTTIGT